MSKRTNIVLQIVWGISLALLFSLAFTYGAQADDGSNANSEVCEFQPMAVDRSPTMNNIRLIQGVYPNITWDNTYLGLHRWTTGQWPAVDYVVNTTVAFKNGGIVSGIEYDDQGGGNSIYIDGIGPCKGWRQFFGHLNYNAADRFKLNQIVDANTVIGEPGCSGFESNCETVGLKISKHNHVTLGYWQNVFAFEGTTPAYAGGYWWVHPARMEGASTNQLATNGEDSEVASDYLVNFSEQKTFSANLNISPLEVFSADMAPFRTFIIIALAILSIFWVGGMLYSSEFRRSMAVFAVFSIIAIVAFVGVNQVSAKSSIYSPPRNDNDVAGNGTGWVVEIPDEENADNKPFVDDGSCSVPGSYPQSVLQWCDIIDKWAAERKIDPNWIAAVMLQESGGQPEILSNSGAVGLLQVMPRDGIAATFKNRQGVPYFSDRPNIEELKVPDFNVEYGTGMLLNLGINSDPREALLRYGPDPDYLLKTYGSRYYYADLIISIYESHK